MSDAVTEDIEATRKRGKKPVLIAVFLALAGAGGGFAATKMGLISLGESQKEDTKKVGASDIHPAALPKISYIDLSPIVVSLESDGQLRHMRFHAQLEVPAQYAGDVEKIRPRIIDVLNGYLRAIDASDLNNPYSLTRMRGHLLRRLNIVAGEGRVRDVLIMELVLN